METTSFIGKSRHSIRYQPLFKRELRTGTYHPDKALDRDERELRWQIARWLMTCSLLLLFTFTPKASGILVPAYKQYWQLFNSIINIIIIIIIIRPFWWRCSKQWSYSMHSSSTLHFASSLLSVLESLEIISRNAIFLSWTTWFP